MKKIGLKDFYNYKYISSLTLSPEGDKLAYIVSSVNEEDNDYDSNLFMMRRDAAGKNWQEVQLVFSWSRTARQENSFSKTTTRFFSRQSGAKIGRRARRSRSRFISVCLLAGAKPERRMNSLFPCRISGNSLTETIC